MPTPLLTKLRAQKASRAAVLHAPASLSHLLADLRGAKIAASDRLAPGCDWIVTFVTKAAQLPEEMAAITAAATDGAIVWCCYPKAKQLGTDLHRDSLHAALATQGWDGVSLVAIDPAWSGMRIKPQV